MEDKLRLNTKFCDFEGIIGRYDYFTNVIYLCAINILFSLPLSIYIMCNIGSLTDYLSLAKIFNAAPIFLKLWVLVGALCVEIVFISNMIRRLNDINGKINTVLNTIIALFSLSTVFAMFFNIVIASLICLTKFIINMFCFFKSGTITANYPYDYRKDFNWGAFFGTWIWGIVNRSYQTFWTFLTAWTPWGWLYAIFCGLKGNEWAYKNKKWDDVNKFNNSQKNQAIIFIALKSFFVMILPIVIMIITFIVILSVAPSSSEIKNNPQQSQQKMDKFENILNKFASNYFVAHKITKNKNKFYVHDEDWKWYSFKEKKNLLDLAASMSASERSDMEKQTKPSCRCSCYSKTNELPRTKIYSYEDNRLLGEFILDETVFKQEKLSFKDAISAAFNAYRFYK